MNNKSKKLLKQFMRFEGLSHRFQMSRMRNLGTYANPLRGQGRVLSILKMQPEISQKELLFLLDMSKQALGELLTKLERNGCITRTPSDKDRRVMNIKLTKEGVKAADNIDTEQSGIIDIFECLSDEEKDSLNEYLERIINHVKNSLADSKGSRGRRRGHMLGAHRHGYDRWGEHETVFENED